MAALEARRGLGGAFSRRAGGHFGTVFGFLAAGVGTGSLLGDISVRSAVLVLVIVLESKSDLRGMFGSCGSSWISVEKME